MLRPPARAVLLLAALGGSGVLGAWPRRVEAAAGEQAISAGVRYGSMSLTQDREPLTLEGGVLALEWERGLGDTYGVRAHVAGGTYDGPSGRPVGGAAAVGLVYRFDIVNAVPYLQASVGGIAASGGGVEATLKPTMELGAGIDFLRSRAFSWGVVLAWDAFASEARFLTAGVRVSWRWGWF